MTMANLRWKSMWLMGPKAGYASRYDQNGNVIEEKVFENGVVKQGSIRRGKGMTPPAPATAKDPTTKISARKQGNKDKTKEAQHSSPMDSMYCTTKTET
jgi:hypothetical protein